MRLTHDVEPFVGGRLAVAMQQPANPVDENLGAAAGNAVEPRGDEPIDDLGHADLRQPRQVNHFGRRQRVQLEIGIAILHRAKEIFVPRERQIGVVAALQEQLHAADFDSLVNLPEDLREAEHVPFARSDVAVERAEVALRHAHVRVVHVAIDDVGDRPIRMLAQADLVGKPAQHVRRGVQIQRERFVCVHAAAAARPCRNVLNVHRRHDPAEAGHYRTRPSVVSAFRRT